MANLQTLANLVAKDLQKAIRMEASDIQGRCQCVTCGVVQSYKVMHACHFVGGRTMGILFEETNIHPQCRKCNVDLVGDSERYGWYMEKRYGMDEIQRLKRLRWQVTTLTRDQLNEMRETYKRRIKTQEVRLGS